ncbi:MAG: chlorite dismutase family protein [Gemmatimonadaceae bacterium]
MTGDEGVAQRGVTGGEGVAQHGMTGVEGVAPQRIAAADSVAHPPETAEGWYALHQVFRRRAGSRQADDQAPGLAPNISGEYSNGWSAVVQLIGSTADVMAFHFRPTLDEIGECGARCMRGFAEVDAELVYSFLSVTEAGFYHITAQLAADAQQRGGTVGDETYRSQLGERTRAELESEHVQRRLYPPPPADMQYVCFYPMSKRRQRGQNWYSLSLNERSRLMQSHGMTGRRYAGRIQQVITGAIGFDSWEWGVTLFAKDPLDFKKLVTDMRFDEVSAKYADFGDFYVGKIASIE